MSTREKKLNKFIKSPEELKGAPTPNYISKIEHLVRPLFDADMGSRLELIRVKLLMSQTELAAKLGIKQTQLSKLENGYLEVAPFTLGTLRAATLEHFHFILFGTGNAAGWNVGHLYSKFWDERLKKRRKPGSGAWKTEQFRAGIPFYFKGKLHTVKNKK
jgi:hypothetical protein